jgi:hypothetical protein
MIVATDHRFEDRERSCSDLVFVNLQGPNGIGVSTRSLPDGGLLGVVPHPNVLGGHPEHGRECERASEPCRTRAF